MPPTTYLSVNASFPSVCEGAEWVTACNNSKLERDACIHISIVSPPLSRSSCAQAANVDRAVCKSSSKPYPSSIGDVQMLYANSFAWAWTSTELTHCCWT